MMGELHGIAENIETLMQYTEFLYGRAGLRDIALEEKPAYERGAQDYVEGRSNTAPPPLCLRAQILDALRRFNQGKRGDELLRVHLVDIDLNAEAIHDHLASLKTSLGASTVRIPDAAGIQSRGLDTVAALERLTADPAIRAQLRTLRYSIGAHRQGLSVGMGAVQGSPYLDEREDAIVSNIRDLLIQNPGRPVLAFYGTDHVAKNMLHNGGPKQDREFAPAALRLDRLGVKVFSLVTLPLSGASRWRGKRQELLWTAKDGSLSNGEPLDMAFGDSPLLYIDPRREPVKLPLQDLNRSRADAFLLFQHGSPAEDRCATR